MRFDRTKFLFLAGALTAGACGSSDDTGTGGADGDAASGASGKAGTSGRGGSSGRAGSAGQVGSSGRAGASGQAGSSGRAGASGQAGSGQAGSAGQAGYTYVVSGEGDLLAPPDLSLVLQKLTFKYLRQAQMTLDSMPRPFVEQSSLAGQPLASINKKRHLKHRRGPLLPSSLPNIPGDV